MGSPVLARNKQSMYSFSRQYRPLRFYDRAFFSDAAGDDCSFIDQAVGPGARTS